MNGFMFSLSFPANVGCVGCGSGEAKEPGGEMSFALIQIRLATSSLEKSCQPVNANWRLEFHNWNIVYTFLSLRLGERMRELSTSIGGLSLER
jgi:hypothetical protein